jgi:hypothetical protein
MSQTQSKRPRNDNELLHFYLSDHYPGRGIKRAFFMDVNKMVALCNNILVKPKHAQKNTADLAIKLRTYVLEVDRAKTKEHILQNPVAYKTTLQCQ